jgi:glycosyltransferase involved in cell wall biosynthesis
LPKPYENIERLKNMSNSKNNNTQNILTIVDQIAETTIPFELALSVSEQKDINVYYATYKVSLDREKIKNVNLILLKNINIVKSILSLIKYVKKHNIDIIHTNHTKGSFHTLLIFKLLYKYLNNPYLEWVHTVHNDFNYFKYYQKMVFKYAIKNANRVICNSHNTLETLPVNNIKCTVIYNGVNIIKVREYRCNNKENLILSANRFVPQKNLESLIRAFSAIHKKFPTWKLYLCGDGPLKTELENLSKDLGCYHKIKFYGNVSREQVYKLMNRSKVYVTPSYWEGFCNANVEAMAAGNALINSNIEPLPEIADNAALYFNPYDLDSLIEKLILLLGKQNFLNELSNRAIKRAELYNIDIAANNYRNYFIKNGH